MRTVVLIQAQLPWRVPGTGRDEPLAQALLVFVRTVSIVGPPPSRPSTLSRNGRSILRTGFPRLPARRRVVRGAAPRDPRRAGPRPGRLPHAPAGARGADGGERHRPHGRQRRGGGPRGDPPRGEQSHL